MMTLTPTSREPEYKWQRGEKKNLDESTEVIYQHQVYLNGRYSHTRETISEEEYFERKLAGTAT